MGLFDFLCKPDFTKPSIEELQQASEQLFEDEALTSALEDESAKILLHWGDQRLKAWAVDPHPIKNFSVATRQVRRTMRAANRLASQYVDLTEIEFVTRLTQLLESVFSPPQEDDAPNEEKRT